MGHALREPELSIYSAVKLRLSSVTQKSHGILAQRRGVARNKHIASSDVISPNYWYIVNTQ